MRYTQHGLSGKCGVYIITNLINGKRYIGASNNMANRINQHFENICITKYADIHPFYADIKKYGRDSFTFECLEFCDKSNKLERERYWYFKLKPEYNLIEPDDAPFKQKYVQQKAKNAQKTEEYLNKMRNIHQSTDFKNKCRNIHASRMQAVSCYDSDGNKKTFDCLCDAARWVKPYRSLGSVVSNIKQSINRNGKAFGYRWEMIGV